MLVLVSLPLIGLIGALAPGVTPTRLDIATSICYAIGTVLLVALVVCYLRRYQPQVYANDRHLLLIALVSVFAAVNIKAGGVPLAVVLSPYQQGFVAVIFVAVAGMILAILLGQQLATVIAGALAIQASFVMDMGIGQVFIVAAFAGAVVGIIFSGNMHDRRGLLHAAEAIAATNILFALILGFLFDETARSILAGVAWAGGGAFVTVAAVWVAIALLERPFGIATRVTLLELANPMGSLLQQLQNEAPGTFMHSVHVANIAERACESIGADALLARVGSQYHDIGKTRRPRFFGENLVYYGENEHDKLSPTLSALVVRAHVKDGLEMARKHKLPNVIVDFIAQHHGTSLVTFFYYRAMEAGGAPLESQFRYEGPIPQSREAGIVMLADTVEAATRSEREPTKERLTDLVERLVDAKVADGQLAESGLTPIDLDQIKSSLVRTLVGMLHSRIEYPDLSEVLEEEKSPDASERDHTETPDADGVVDSSVGGDGSPRRGCAADNGADGGDNGQSGDPGAQPPLLPEGSSDKRACVSE